MLKSIHCNDFNPEFKTITFHKGLNTIIGDPTGKSAIGKSSLLWIIDMGYGNTQYKCLYQGIKDYVGNSPIDYTFEFDDQKLFVRIPMDSDDVKICDASWNVKKELNIGEYRKTLNEYLKLSTYGLSINQFYQKIDRIHGNNDDLELYPYKSKSSEKDTAVINFLIRLGAGNNILDDIEIFKKKYHIDESQVEDAINVNSYKNQHIENDKEIKSKNDKLSMLKGETSASQLNSLGFNKLQTKEYFDIQNRIRNLVREKNKISSQITAIEEKAPYDSTCAMEDFQQLKLFFPDTNIKTLQEIEEFHRQIRVIVNNESKEEKERLQRQSDLLDQKIEKLKLLLKDTNVPNNITENRINQCLDIIQEIKNLENANKDLDRKIEKLELIKEHQDTLGLLLDRKKIYIDNMVSELQKTLSALNDIITSKTESAPIFTIDEYKMINYIVRHNSSEISGYKNMIVYDFSLNSLYKLPFLMYDTHITSRLGIEYLEAILKLATSFNNQIFMTFDKVDLQPENIKSIIDQSRIVSMSRGHELFGNSWINDR